MEVAPEQNSLWNMGMQTLQRLHMSLYQAQLDRYGKNPEGWVTSLDMVRSGISPFMIEDEYKAINKIRSAVLAKLNAKSSQDKFARTYLELDAYEQSLISIMHKRGLYIQTGADMADAADLF